MTGLSGGVSRCKGRAATGRRLTDDRRGRRTRGHDVVTDSPRCPEAGWILSAGHGE